MTRRREKGENEITREVKKRCRKSRENPCDVLADMLKKAKQANDQALIDKIKEAQKFMGCRNARKRESQQ
ncbi:MAG TPA: hypothetical protein VMG10_05860 [Gemmataceae bacterium]|nr:hypothetical protein [Gemmataceae bacterium]